MDPSTELFGTKAAVNCPFLVPRRFHGMICGARDEVQDMWRTESAKAGLSRRPYVWVGIVERFIAVTQEDESRCEGSLIGEIAMRPFTQDATVINVIRRLIESRSG